jgi:hypothetical protein
MVLFFFTLQFLLKIMIKKFTLLSGFLGIWLAGFAQVQWRQLPPNPNLSSGSVSGYDVAVEDGGVFYVVYNLFNSTTGYYDIWFDYYNAEDGWQNMLVHNTTCNSNIDVKTIRSATNIYAMANTNGSSQLTLFQIGGLSAYELVTNNFPSFSPATSKWNIYPGVSNGELYFMYTYGTYHFINEFDYGTQSWLPHGDPFSPASIVANDFSVYVSQDSVFVAGQYTTTPGNKLKFTRAAKSNWIWSNYTPANGDVYALNGGVADTVTGNDTYFVFGDQNGTKKLLAKDNGTSKEIPVTSSGYGEGAAFPLNYDIKAQMTSSATQPYLMTTAWNLTDQHVVYTRDWSTGVWSQFGNGAFAPNSITVDHKQIQTAPSTERLMLGYVDQAATPDEYVLMLSNNAPTVLDPGTAGTDLCGNSSVMLLEDMIIGDDDGDYISYLSVSSSDNTLINPADVSVSVFNNGPSATIYADVANTADVTSVETVTLTFNFSDGFDQLQHIVTYEIQPAVQVSWTDDTLMFCTNADIVDLYDYVSLPGGVFSGNETEYPGHYYDPTLVNNPVGFYFDLHYTYHSGACVSDAYVTIGAWEAPSAVIAATPATNCTSNDGTATLDISGGAAPYTFIWNTGEYTDTDLFGLAPGMLHADVTDDNGCVTVADAIVENAGANITAVITPVSCYGAGDGAIDLTVGGLATPLIVLWSNGYSTEDVSLLQPGTHEVWITDASGCSVTKTFSVPEPDELRLELFASGTTCGGNEGYVVINYAGGGTQPYNYLWTSGSAADSIGGLTSGFYGLTITDDNGCTVTETAGVYDFDAPYIYEPQVIEANCNQNDGEIYVYMEGVGTNPQMLWSNGETDGELTGLAPGVYTLDVFNDENCHSYYTVEVNVKAPDRQPICVVTVDSTTSSNLVVWEKLGDNAIDHFNVYRETMVPGQFQLIDTVENTNMSIFNDVVASPIERSWKYRITAVNECGVESVPSIAHKTIHLTTLDLGNGDFKVVWNFYEGTSYTTFNVYRFTNTTGWELISTTPASQPYYIDTPPNTDGLDYMVDFELADACTADFTRAQDFNSARSNKDKGQFSAGNGTGDSHNGLIEANFGNGTVYLYPNPVTGGQAFVQLDGVQSADYTIVSITGQHVASGQLAEGTSTLRIGELRAGIYLLHLFDANGQTSIRFIKE